MPVVEIGEETGLNRFPAKVPTGDEAGRRDVQPDRHRQEGAELAEVMLATLVGSASLVAVGFDVDPAMFQRTLERLVDP